MAWRRPVDKPLSEPMTTSLPTHICITRPQWVNLKELLNKASMPLWYDSPRTWPVLVLHLLPFIRSIMPRRHQPDTLKTACIHCMARHESSWGQEDLTRLPPSLTETLLDEVLQRMISRGPDLNLLQHFDKSAFFGIQVNHVKYSSWCCQADRLDIIDGCFVRFLHSCKGLVHLELNVGAMDLSSLGIHRRDGGAFYLLNGCDLSKLQVLHMEYVMLCKDAMEMIGGNCSRLRELHLRSDGSVNDDTIKLLIRKGLDGECMLKHLKVLDVRCTNISHRGVRHILECIPTITHLYHHEVAPVALQLLQCGALTPPLHLECLEIQSLDQLIYDMEHTTKHPLDFSVFSNVKSLDILLEHTECEQLKVFHPIKNLCKLKISPKTQPSNQSTWDFSSLPLPSLAFDPLVSTLIEIVGGNLYELWLEDVTLVSFLTIGKSCPTLRGLHIDFQSVQSKERPIGLQNYFQNIEELDLCQISFDMIHPETEQIILGLISPMRKIKSLELSDIKLSNTFLLSLLPSNPLNDVEMISLVGSDIKMISDDISWFTKQCAKLRKLSIWYANLYDSIYLSEFGFHRKLTEKIAGRGCNVELWLKTDPPNSICDSDEDYPFVCDTSWDDGDYWLEVHITGAS